MYWLESYILLFQTVLPAIKATPEPGLKDYEPIGTCAYVLKSHELGAVKSGDISAAENCTYAVLPSLNVHEAVPVANTFTKKNPQT